MEQQQLQHQHQEEEKGHDRSHGDSASASVLTEAAAAATATASSLATPMDQDPVPPPQLQSSATTTIAVTSSSSSSASSISISPSPSPVPNSQAMHMQNISRMTTTSSMAVPMIPSIAQSGQPSASNNAQWIQGSAKHMQNNMSMSSMTTSSCQSNGKQQIAGQRVQNPQLQQQQPLPAQLHLKPTPSQEQNPQQSQQPWGASQMASGMQQSQHIRRGPMVQKATSVASPPVPLMTSSPNVVSSSGDLLNQSNKKIISKRSIQDLVAQIDHSKKMNPQVEDGLVEIVEDFVNSVVTFGCALAKHRKSDTLEPRDILLHFERNWNLIIPGFAGDEYKSYKRPVLNENHKQRLAVIRKSIAVSQAGTESTNPKETAVVGNGNINSKASQTKGLQE